ncbi:hypothetical protein Pelo_16703 [Pelomyxa schiedti]|nr:hypothetical protein Pelo_16703 [Pelomyxa schiedti]
MVRWISRCLIVSGSMPHVAWTDSRDPTECHHFHKEGMELKVSQQLMNFDTEIAVDDDDHDGNGGRGNGGNDAVFIVAQTS